MNIDERFLASKPISEILGLSLELKDYEDRVQKRYDYIQEQLEKDPEFVAYDYIEYYPKLCNVVYATKKNLISTNGDFYKLKGDVWIKARSKQSGPYKTKGIRFANKQRTPSCHRIIACVFLPKPIQHSGIPLHELDVNHKDGNKSNNDISNLEWMTPSENVRHALELGLKKSGMEDLLSIPYLATIMMEGPYKGLQFTLVGRTAFNQLGFEAYAIRKSIRDDFLMMYGCKWEIIRKIDVYKYQSGAPEGFIELLRNNPQLANPKIKPILVTINKEKYNGHQFCLFGRTDVEAHGFTQSGVSYACAHKSNYYNCHWKYVTQEEASQYPRGASEEIIKHIKSR